MFTYILDVEHLHPFFKTHKCHSRGQSGPQFECVMSLSRKVVLLDGLAWEYYCGLFVFVCPFSAAALVTLQWNIANLVINEGRQTFKVSRSLCTEQVQISYLVTSQCSNCLNCSGMEITYLNI